MPKVLFLLLLTSVARSETPSPAENPGRIDGWNYSQDYFGLSWSLPEDASIQSAALTKKQVSEGLKELADGPLGDALKISAEHTHTLLTLTLEPSARKARDGVVILAVSERLPEAAGVETGADYFRMMNEMIQAGGIPYAPRGKPSRETLGGRPFDSAAFSVGVGTDPSKLAGNSLFVAIRDDHALAFSLVYDTEEGRRKGREILAHIRFSTAAWPLDAAPTAKPVPSKALSETVEQAYQYQTGKGRAPDMAKAVALYRRAADAGNAEAQARLGALYAAGTGVPQNDAEAARWRRKAARQHDLNAMYNLAMMYADGQGVERSDFEAAGWLNQAGRYGSVDALRLLGDNSYRGAGVPRSAEMAYRYFSYAAQLGDAESQYRAGMMASMGDGTTRDNSAAFALFEKAAAQGQMKAQEELSALYGAGLLGVPQDKVKSLKWSRAAAEQGSTLGQMMLGLAYLHGEVIPQDYAEAARWIRRAAEAGDADAQRVMADLHAKGQGVPRDEKEAARWRALAAVKR